MNQSVLDIKLQAAINEAVKLASQPLYKEVIETWLSDYKELWDEMIAASGVPVPLEMLHGRTMCEFDSIYRHLAELVECYSIEIVCGAAMNEYDEIMRENKNVHENVLLQKWVRKNEGVEINYGIICSLADRSVNYVRNIYGATYAVSGNDFKRSVEFLNCIAQPI